MLNKYRARINIGEMLTLTFTKANKDFLSRLVIANTQASASAIMPLLLFCNQRSIPALNFNALTAELACYALLFKNDLLIIGKVL